MVAPELKLSTLQWVVLCISFSSAQDLVQRNLRNSTASTCPYRTINYITHSLPQQCLATTSQVTASRQGNGVSNRANNLTLEEKEELQIRLPGTQSSSIGYPETVTTDLENLLQASPLATDERPSPGSAGGKSEGAVENAEEESELESGKFLSFEEWKKQNLKQSEQLAHRNPNTVPEGRKRPSNVHSSLESLGDEGEIDIDFSGFVPGGPQPAREVSQPVGDPYPDADGVNPSRAAEVLRRSKDAGTTCKERFNYASFDCAANVLKTNKEAKSPLTVLMENKDSYMLNQCKAANKFLILELCNDVWIDTIVLANFEFFSSTFRTFKVSVSNLYPVETDKWKTLGTYEARNTREIQAFLVENSIMWARYVRIEFLTHYGNEFYCPVSLVRIHGKTMIEEWKKENEDNEDHNQEQNYDTISVNSLTPEAIAEVLEVKTQEAEQSILDESTDLATFLEPSIFTELASNIELADASSIVPASVIAFEAIMSVIESSDTCIAADSPAATTSRTAPGPASPARNLDASTTTVVSNTTISQSSPQSRNLTSSHPPAVSGSSAAAMKNVGDAVKSATPPAFNAKSVKSSRDPSSEETSSINGTSVQNQKSSSSSSFKTSSMTAQQPKEKPTASSSERTKSSGSPSQAQPAVPTMQDSFFKSVHKRLRMLEANSSLSLQYIEDQSRALRDAFKKVEQRQLTKTTAFLDQLNQTVLNELRDFRQQYDQLWQSTVIELELQRERYERDNEAINARLGILADEVIFQRRMAILQMVLILVCLVLVLFSRGVINNYLELPLVQNVLSKSPSSKWLNLSSADSAGRPPQPTRMRSAHQLRNGILKGHRRMQSEDSITDTQSGPEIYAPPTPVSDYGQSEVELSRNETKSPAFESDKDDNKFDDPEFDPNSIERPSTSPPVLRVNGASLVSDILENSEEDVVADIPPIKSNSIPNNSTSVALTTEFMPMGKRLSWNLPDP